MQLRARYIPRISLRAIFVVLTLVTLALLYHFDWIWQRRELIESGEIFGTSAPPVRAPGILGLFGEAGYAEIIGGASADETEERVERRLARPFPEAEIGVEIYCPPESFESDRREPMP